jgi:hypothetical protein
MTRLFAPLALLLALEAVAAAEITPNDLSIANFDPENMVAPVSTVEGPGVKVGEGTTLYPVFGVETGFVSNVFYQPDNPQAAGLLRLLAQIGAGSLNAIRLTPADDSDPNKSPGSFQYRANLRASYDLMLSGEQAIQGTGGLGLGATLRGLTNPAGRWSFGFDDEFMRLIRAANFETDANTNRDINTVTLNLLYHPADSSISGFAYYANTIDVFERSQQQFANRMLNVFGLHPQWRWLPQTYVYADLSIGYNTGIGSSLKVSSTPLNTIAGIATLLTLKTTFDVHAGYTNGFYSTGASYSSPTVGTSLGYRYSPFGRVMLSYDWLYSDSVNANFYRDHVIRLWWQQLVVPFAIMVQPEVHFREYQGVSTLIPGAPDTRDDTIVSVVAGVSYSFRNWIAAALDYHFTDVSTDYRYMCTGMCPVPQLDPSFVRHELLLGVRVAM